MPVSPDPVGFFYKTGQSKEKWDIINRKIYLNFFLLFSVLTSLVLFPSSAKSQINLVKDI